MLLGLQFAICTALIVFSGSRLSKYGDVLAEKTHMGRTWVGVLLMASVTSLPELVTGISSVAIYKLPSIAAGDVLGSCVFNLLIFAILDLGRKHGPLSAAAHQGQILTAGFGILLLGLATLCIPSAAVLPALGWIGVSSIVFLVLYGIAMRLVFKYEKKRIAEYLSEVRQETRYEKISKSEVYRQFALHAAVVVGAATYLPHIAEGVAAITGLGQTFVGSVFVAASTSLPEIVVSRAALKMGAIDLAVGNLLGSNLINIAILGVDDIFYFQGPILRHISAEQAITTTAAMMMTAILMISLVYRPKKKLLFVSWDSLGIFLIYALTVFLLLVER